MLPLTTGFCKTRVHERTEAIPCKESPLTKPNLTKASLCSLPHLPSLIIPISGAIYHLYKYSKACAIYKHGKTDNRYTYNKCNLTWITLCLTIRLQNKEKCQKKYKGSKSGKGTSVLSPFATIDQGETELSSNTSTGPVQ